MHHVCVCKHVNNEIAMAVSLSVLVTRGLYGTGDVFVHLLVYVCQK